MMLVGFKFCVVFFSTVGGVIAIFNDTVAVSAVFAIKFDTIAILRAGGHMLRTDPICNYLVGDNIHVLWLLIMMMTNHLIVALLWIFQFSVFPPSHVRLCKVKVKNGKDLVALHLNWYKRLEIIVPYILQTYTNLKMNPPCNRSRRREQGRRPCRRCMSTKCEKELLSNVFKMNLSSPK